MGKNKDTTLPETNKATPPKTIKRNEFGLLENVEYIFGEDNLVDWRAMVPKEFLVPNKQVFKGKEVPTSIEGLKDNQLLLLLGAIKYLGQLRGIKDVKYTITSPSENYVVAICSITFIPNYETEGREITFSAIGDAHPRNTNGFGQNYLGPIAENRAFVRCVRNFLKINIVSQEEIGGPQIPDNTPTDGISAVILKQTMEQHNIPFEKVKARLIEEKVSGAENFNSVDDIPVFLQFKLVARIKEKAKEKAKENEKK